MRCVALVLIIPVLAVITSGCGNSDQEAMTEEPSEQTVQQTGEVDETAALLPRTEELLDFEKASSDRKIPFVQLADYLGDEFEMFGKYHVSHAAAADYMATDSDLQYALEIFKFEPGSYAFGAYSMLREPDMDFLSLGTQGFVDSTTLVFYSGDYLVRITGYHESAQSDSGAVTLAEAVDGDFGESPGFPMAIQLMPEKGRIENTETYVPSGFADVKFFSPTYTCKYELADTISTLFFIPRGSTAELHQYEEFLSARSGKVVKATMDDILIFMCDDDRFERVILTSRAGRVAGVLRTPDRDNGLLLLKSLWERVAEYENRAN